jgi:hypothetical protein
MELGRSTPAWSNPATSAAGIWPDVALFGAATIRGTAPDTSAGTACTQPLSHHIERQPRRRREDSLWIIAGVPAATRLVVLMLGTGARSSRTVRAPGRAALTLPARRSR